MRSITLTSFLVIGVLLFTGGASAHSDSPVFPSLAFWIWTPKTKTLVNPKSASKDTPEKQFEFAMKLYKEKDYKNSAQEFVNLVNAFKDSDLAPEAQYYAGRSYEESGKYYSAFEAYQKVIGVYPFSKRIDEIIEREFSIGTSLYKKHRGTLMGREIMTDLDRASEIFTKVKQNSPFGEYAERAQFMLGECYKKSEQYSEAKKAFQQLIDDYPNGALTEKAKYEGAQCTYLGSLNPDYDQVLTDQAIKEFKRIAEEENGLTASDEAEEAILILEDKKAESIYKIAKFYERQKHYESAAIYYNEILIKYPYSTFKKLAAERLKVIERHIDGK